MARPFMMTLLVGSKLGRSNFTDRAWAQLGRGIFPQMFAARVHVTATCTYKMYRIQCDVLICCDQVLRYDTMPNTLRERANSPVL